MFSKNIKIKKDTEYYTCYEDFDEEVNLFNNPDDAINYYLKHDWKDNKEVILYTYVLNDVDKDSLINKSEDLFEELMSWLENHYNYGQPQDCHPKIEVAFDKFLDSIIKYYPVTELVEIGSDKIDIKKYKNNDQ